MGALANTYVSNATPHNVYFRITRLYWLSSAEVRPFPAVLFDDGERLPAHYEFELSGEVERVAGRECQDLILSPRDSQRFGFRFCADKATSLPLRAQTVGPEGILTQVVFNTLEIGKNVNAEALRPTWNTKDWKVVEVPLTKVDLAAEGWRIPLPPISALDTGRSQYESRQAGQAASCF